MDTPPAEAPAQRSLPTGPLTAAIGLTVVAVALVFLFETNLFTSRWYALFKLVHVVGAVAWVGGGLTLTILAARAERSSDPIEMAMIARQAAFVGERVFAPIGLIVFLAGIAMVINLHWGWDWIVIGLVGYVLHVLTGLLVLGPQAKRVGQLIEQRRRGGRDPGGDPADPAHRPRRHGRAPARRGHGPQALHLRKRVEHVTVWSRKIGAMDDDQVFKALADPTRRHLLDRLFERDGRTLKELESELEMTRFGVMKHLRVLEDAGLVVPAGRAGEAALPQPGADPRSTTGGSTSNMEHRVAALADLKHELEESA